MFKRLHVEVVFISVFIVLSLSLSGCTDSENKTDMITALEGKKVADIVADKWNVEAILIRVTSTVIGNDLDDKGESNSWFYIYIVVKEKEDDINICDELRVEINSKGEKEESTSSGNYNGDEIQLLVDWTIDSDDAIRIAKEDQNVKEFLEVYPDSIFGMSIESDTSEELNEYGKVWIIHWYVIEGNYDTLSAKIWIDYTSGDVIFSENEM